MAAVVWKLGITGGALLGAWVVGIALCLMKGESGGLAMAVGNLSAPYVIVAVIAGLTVRQWWVAALLGIVATEATVSGFYGTWGTFFGHEVSRSAVMLWGGAGLFSGALFGALGSIARRRPGFGYVLPALLLLEPITTQVGFLVTSRFGIGYAGQLDSRQVFAYSIEIAAGLAVFLLVRYFIRKQRRKSTVAAAA